MNYNFPYYSMLPMTRVASLPIKGNSGGIFSKLLGGVNISSILTNTQKTLNLVNQTIPIVKQINPLVKNAKTMFRVMNEFKKVDDINSSNSINTNNSANILNNQNNDPVSNNVNNNSSQMNGPVFFIN